MTEKPSLAEFTIDPYISPLDARSLTQNILGGKPGLFPITGQAGVGKTTTLFMIAYYSWQQGFPVIVLTEDRELLNSIHFCLPESWVSQYIEPSEQAWLNAIQQVITANPSTVIVIDQLSGNNDEAALMAAKAKHWVFTCIDTPFVGLDVLYNLKAWGLTNQEILENVSGIFSQMLLPRLCDNCAQLRTVSLEETRFVYPESHQARELWCEVGCSVCNNQGTGGGRYGFCAAFEVLQIDEEVKPLLADYLESNILRPLPACKHFTVREGSRELVKSGRVGIRTYQREILQNPLLRVQHFWEQESLRASQIQGMFGRFVTQQLVEKLMSQQDFERIIEGERRYVTCFFCDVRGFTTRAEQSSPVEIFLTLNRYFREIIDIVFRYEGTIDKFIGDSVMVVFGAPTEQPDHELRAVQCAISIQQKVAEINQLTDVHPIHIGIGINSGEVVAGCLGSDRRMDYTVLGDVVNTAARLESHAQPGQILIGPETYSAVQEKVECREMGALTLKGKLRALEIFEVSYVATDLQQPNRVEESI